MKTVRAEGLSTMTGSSSCNAKVDLVDSPDGCPRTSGVCCGVWSTFVVWAADHILCVVWPRLSHKQDVV